MQGRWGRTDALDCGVLGVELAARRHFGGFQRERSEHDKLAGLRHAQEVVEYVFRVDALFRCNVEVPSLRLGKLRSVTRSSYGGPKVPARLVSPVSRSRNAFSNYFATLSTLTTRLKSSLPRPSGPAKFAGINNADSSAIAVLCSHRLSVPDLFLMPASAFDAKFLE